MLANFYRWETCVRDYELDIQGLVNNATFVNYFEQCRNDFVRKLGIDFIAYHHEGYDLVIAGIEVQYRYPLRSGDAFYVTAKITAYDDKRVHFEQEIRLVNNNRLVAKAVVYVACINNKTGKSGIPEKLKTQLAQIQSEL